MTDSQHECFTVDGTSYMRNLDRERLNGKWAAIHYQKPPTRNEEQKTTSFGMRFPLLIVADYVEQPQEIAEKIARILNQHWEDEQP